MRVVVEELKAKKETTAIERIDEDKAYLKETLITIKVACESYNERTADETLTMLRKKTWSPQTSELLSKISEQLLHSDFDEIADSIDKFLERQ